MRAELAEFGVVGEAADKILAFIGIGGSNDAVLAALRALDCDDATFREGVEELDKVVHYAYLYGIPEKNIAIDLTIARGLDYYTGTVYETKLVDYPTLGSVCSGGRYDNLTGYYTDDHMPGIGISIGLTRLFSQLRAAEIITDTKKSLCDVLFVPTDKAHMDFVLGSAAEMRAAGLNVDVYCLDKGMKPKMKLICEIKSHSSPENNKRAVKAVVDAVKNKSMEANVDYIAFDYDICKQLKEAMPAASVQYLGGDKTPAEVAADKLSGIDYQYSTVLSK